VTGDYSVYSRKGGVDLYFHTFVLWASDRGWIEQTLNSRWSPLETEVFLCISADFKGSKWKGHYVFMYDKISMLESAPFITLCVLF
jgi:hypothetical protein